MTDPIILSKLNQLAGLIAAMKSGTGTTASTGPKVDFIVDMFDRPDGALGQYWGSSQTTQPQYFGGMQIINHILVPAGSSPFPFEYQNSDTYPYSGYGQTSYTTATSSLWSSNMNGATAMYIPHIASLSATSVTIEIGIKINAPLQPVPTIITTDGSGIIINVNSGVINHIAAAFGAFVGSANGNTVGMAGEAGVIESVNSGNSTVFTYGYLSGASFASIAQPVITVTNGAQLTGNSSGLNLAGGTNHVIKFVFSSASSIMYVDGTQVAQTVGMTGMNSVGICMPIMNFLFFLNYWIGGTSLGAPACTPYSGVVQTVSGTTTQVFDCNPVGIRYFKAWNSANSTPGDQTGFGTVSNGTTTYSDKYHSGSTYNPNA